MAVVLEIEVWSSERADEEIELTESPSSFEAIDAGIGGFWSRLLLSLASSP